MAKFSKWPMGLPRDNAQSPDRLKDLADFGSNPGNLRARCYVPDTVSATPALVVVLHGCTQTAAGYDACAGWTALADARGFVVLFPEQQRANNPNLCFNWFLPGDTRRDQGEALSIRQMIAALVSAHGIDPGRIFITGLSAGGAMTSVMLATYPEVFAGGAIIAGLPYGTASGVPQALERMSGKGLPSGAQLGAAVRAASAHAGPWPTVSVWHGSADATVSAANADAIVAQWRAVQGLADAAAKTDTIDGYPHRIWQDAAGRVAIERYDITGLGHGTPLDPARTSGERTGPHMLDAGISSTRHIAASWGLADAIRQEPLAKRATSAATAPTTLPVRRTVRPERIYDAPKHKPAGTSVGQIIEDALRAAGLMR